MRVSQSTPKILKDRANFKTVFITQDRTQAERLTRRNFVKESRVKIEEKPNHNHFIQKGQVNSRNHDNAVLQVNSSLVFSSTPTTSGHDPASLEKAFVAVMSNVSQSTDDE